MSDIVQRLKRLLEQQRQADSKVIPFPRLASVPRREWFSDTAGCPKEFPS